MSEKDKIAPEKSHSNFLPQLGCKTTLFTLDSSLAQKRGELKWNQRRTQGLKTEKKCKKWTPDPN